MKKTMTVLGAAAATAMLLAGCSWCKSMCSTDSTCSASTACPAMNVNMLYGEWDAENTPDDVDATIMFAADGKVNGCAGVNRYFGSFEVDAAKGMLKFGDAMGATKMAGPPAAMTYEDNFLKSLSEVDRFAINGDKLMLCAGDKVLLVFDRED